MSPSSARRTLSIRLWLPLLALTTGLACNSEVLIEDSWGTSGYARFAGTVTRADGRRYGKLPMHWACGPESATGFGSGFSTRADGTFDIEVESPGPWTVAADGLFACRVNVALPLPHPASAVFTRAAFGSTAAERRITTFAIHEGVVVDSTR